MCCSASRRRRSRRSALSWTTCSRGRASATTWMSDASSSPVRPAIARSPCRRCRHPPATRLACRLRRPATGHRRRRGDRLAAVLSLLRLGVQVVLFFTLLSVVIGLATAETGLVEKGALVALGGVVIWVAALVRRIGGRSTARSG